MSDDNRPLARLRPDDGKPTWEQVNDLFTCFGMLQPDWRMRDELVCWMMWARYGEELSAEIEAIRTQLAEAQKHGLLLVRQLRTVQMNAKHNGEVYYHPKSPMAETIKALDRSLSQSPNTEEISSVVRGREG